MIRWLMPVFDQLPLISSPGLQNHISKTQRAEPAHRNSLSSLTFDSGYVLLMNRMRKESYLFDYFHTWKSKSKTFSRFNLSLKQEFHIDIHILHTYTYTYKLKIIKKALSYQHAFSTINANLNIGNSPTQIKKKEKEFWIMHPHWAQHCIFEDLKPRSIKPSNIFGTRGMSRLPVQDKGQLTRLAAALHHHTSTGNLECAPLCPPHSCVHTYSFFHFVLLRNIFWKTMLKTKHCP